MVQNRWRPTDLLFIQQVRMLLHDMEHRFKRLEAARSELETLRRAEFYIKVLTRIRLYLRKAMFNWKANQLVFLEAASGFYSEYGQLLRLLKFDSMGWRQADQRKERQGV